MSSAFQLCEHPELPGQLVRMVTPRNGWQPVEPETADPDSVSSDDDEPDDPNAGKSIPTENDTQEH